MQLGITVRDTITGLSGVVTGHCRYISGCSQALVQPPVKGDGDFVEGKWFDEQRLERIGDSVVALNNGETPGADIPAPIR